MELRQIQYALAIASHGSFTRAALELRLAQPALSRQIQQLERELGVLLFDRSRRRISLTPAGDAFVARGVHLLAEVDALRDEMQEFAGLLRGRVVIGALQSLAELRLPGLLAAFHQRYPGIEVALREGNTGPLIAQLLAGQLDLAVIHRIASPHLSETGTLGVQIEPLYGEELVLIMPPSHRLAGHTHVSLADTSEDAFIAAARGSALWQTLVDSCQSAGFSPRLSFESGELSIARALVAAELGLALVPRSVAEAPGPPVHTARLLQPTPLRTVSLAWRQERPRTAAATTLLAFAREYLLPPED